MKTDEAVKQLEDLKRDRKSFLCGDPEYDDIYNADIAAIDVALAHLRTGGMRMEMKWIPVSERLPDKNGKYLCCWQGKAVDTGFFFNRHWRLCGEVKDKLVTAWMPLPELYRKDGEHES